MVPRNRMGNHPREWCFGCRWLVMPVCRDPYYTHNLNQQYVIGDPAAPESPPALATLRFSYSGSGAHFRG